jgi:N-acyl-D-amino-acid deacylase
MSESAFDLILSGGTVLDGSGAPKTVADVGIRDDRIAAVGDLAAAHAGVRWDATGMAVAPGFIDAHTHDDLALLHTPEMAFKVSQGVTTVIVGNCGISPAPLQAREALPRPLDLLGDAAWFRFPDFSDYLAALDADPPAVNAAALVGHTTLRADAMSALDRPAMPQELGVMAAKLEEGLSVGAAGLSSGLAYSTAAAAPAAEVAALARLLGPHRGVYATHLRDESERVLEAMEEALDIAGDTGIPVIFSHHKVAGRANYGRSVETLALLESTSRHRPVGVDAYPYTAGATELSADRVAWADRVLITFSKAAPEAAGRELGDVARELGVSIAEAIRRLHPAGAIYFIMDETDVRRILAWPGVMIGSDSIPADAHPHPRVWGAFPRVLGRYSRDLGLLPLEEAVRRMTSLPAGRFGLADRGVLRPGAYADVVVFDPRTVNDRATYEAPQQPAAGIELVLVNGRAVWAEGQPTGARPGRALRRNETGELQ